MKAILILLIITTITSATAQIKFEDYFTDNTLRLNYIIAGNKDSCEFFFNSFKQQGQWGGRTNKLDTTQNYGEYLLEVYCQKDGKKIYCHQYKTLFQEWQTTPQAAVEKHAYRECAIMPTPKQKATITISKRNKNLQFVQKLKIIFDPQNYFTNIDNPTSYNIEKIITNGNPKQKIDIVFLPEGYTQDQLSTFLNTVKSFTNKLFSVEPYKSNKSKFNVSAILAPSNESGCDQPNIGVWKNTLLDFSFSTFDMERYLATENYWAVCDLASLVPYDQIIILCNTKKYGGGGIYNFYSAFAAANKYSPDILIHEFGHAFAGLGDEYEGDVTYQDFQQQKIEPISPNLTTLTNFHSKWANLIDKNTPIPTPINFGTPKTLGAFVGGGYAKDGVFRPQKNCIMHDLETKEYCKVCFKTILETINLLSQ